MQGLERPHARKAGRHRISLSRAADLILLGLGVIGLIVSIVYVYSVLAFISLGLIFWGAILLYVQTEEYTKKALLATSVLPLLVTLDQILRELEYKGKAAYLPPEYFENPENTKIYVARQTEAEFPTQEQIQKYENELFLPEGLLLTPPGAELTRLFEETLGTSFTKVDLRYLQQNLPRLFIEDLELADNMEIETTNNKVETKDVESTSLLQAKSVVNVRITNSAYNEMCKETSKLTNIQSKIGCPLCSAIACALTKATGKPVIIGNTQLSEDGKTIETAYRVLEAAESQEQTREGTEVQLAGTHYSRLSKLAGISLMGLGSIILSFVGWITYYDRATFGKSFAHIFLDPRTGEAMSLGIGMRVLYYFVLGLASTLIGILVLLRRRRNKKKQPISSTEPGEE